jgi:hypothetical protein
MKTSDNLYVEEQHQLKISPQKYEHLFDGTLGEFSMETASISLHLMDPDCKPFHTQDVEHELFMFNLSSMSNGKEGA